MSTVSQILSADELFALPDHGGHCELIKGVLLTMSPAGEEHGAIGMTLAGDLSVYVRKAGLGRAYLSETGFKISSDPDTVYCPDGSFVSQERLSKLRNRRGFVPFAPDLAIEVLSPTDSRADTFEKIANYLAAGTLAVILVDPLQREVSVYRPQTPPVVLRETEILEVPEVVPGWCFPLKELFDCD